MNYKNDTLNEFLGNPWLVPENALTRIAGGNRSRLSGYWQSKLEEMDLCHRESNMILETGYDYLDAGEGSGMSGQILCCNCRY